MTGRGCVWVRLFLHRADASPELRNHLEDELRRRYRQYETAPFVELLTFTIEHLGGWSASR